MKFAVIETGGKQYIVKEKDKLKVEKLAVEKDTVVKFDKVLLVAEGQKVQLGKPYVSGAAVEAKALDQGRADKIVVMKYKSKTRYRRKAGHRQPYTEVLITKI